MVESTKKYAVEEKGRLKFALGCVDYIFVFKNLVENMKKKGRRYMMEKNWKRRMIKYIERNYGGYCMSVVLKVTLLGVLVVYMMGLACMRFKRGDGE